MKKIILLILLIFSHCSYLFARQVNTFEIKLIVNNFLEIQSTIRKISKPEIQKARTLRLPSSNQVVANVIELDTQGFVVVTNDTDLPPIVAFSFNQDWIDDTSSQNVLYHLLVNDLAWRRKALLQLPANCIKEANREWEIYLSETPDNTVINSFIQWPAIGSTRTGGWVETTWHQDSPYNSFCPIDPEVNIRCVVGCVATAMSQIVNYHKYLGDLQFDPKDRYTIESRIHIDQDSTLLDFPSFRQLNIYIDSLKLKYQNGCTLSDVDIAALSFACGISMQMAYSYDGSGAAGDISYALIDKLGYFGAEYRSSGSGFYFELKDNMMNGYPACMIVLRSKDFAGHALVVDGYNTDGFFHVNYGYGPSVPSPILDIWYLIPLNLELGFDFINGINIHIMPQKNNYLELNTEKIVFDSIGIGEKSNIQNCTIHNNSADAIQIDYIKTTDNFKVGTTPEILVDSLESLLINAGDSLSLFLQCIPDDFGVLTGKLLISFLNHNKFISIDLFGYVVSQAGTIINSDLVSGIWSKARSPYLICNDIEINADDKLVIEPGTNVIFLGQYKLEIGLNAQLVAKGIENETINFQAKEGFNWSGMNFNYSSNDDTLSFCTISDIGNILNEYSIYIIRSSPVFDNILFSNNFGIEGVLSLNVSAAKIDKMKITNNRTFGSVVQIKGSSTECEKESGKTKSAIIKSPIIKNTLICKNSTGPLGTVTCLHTAPTFINVTISHNETIESYAGAISLLGSGNRVRFINSILMPNKTKYGRVLVSPNSRDTLSFEYSNVDTNDVKWIEVKKQMPGLKWGEGNICQDPQFADPENSDFTLAHNSPCIDSGNPDYSYNDVYDPYRPGYALRPAMGTCRSDMGAYGGGMSDLINDSAFMPDDYSLLQNYPNPFNSTTTIEFSILFSEDVTITVYNIYGQEVRNLLDSKVDPGKYKIFWDGKNNHGLEVGSGIYFCNIRSKSFHKTKKMSYIK
jgi:hypothetical protein